MPARRTRFALAALLMVAMVQVAVSRDTDPSKQRDAQRSLQTKLDTMARRTGSTIDAMVYQRLSPSAEQKMLEDVAESLKGLSESQVKQVIDHLEAAIKAPDEGTATKEQREAYIKHRQIVSQLRGMFNRLDVIKNLDEAAARLDRVAAKQLDLNGESLARVRNRQTGRARRNNDDRDEMAGEQGDLKAEVDAVFKQVKALVPHLNAEQKERVDKVDAVTRGQKLVAKMAETIANIQRGNFDDAAEAQRRHVKELKDLADALRSRPGDKLEALKAARAKVERAIEGQKKVNEETARPEPPQGPDRRGRPPVNATDPKQARANELGQEQAKVELDTHDARKAVAQVEPEIAKRVGEAQTQQSKAEDKLRDTDFEGAKSPEDKALDALKDAAEQLDKKIAEAELAKKDPLAAVKNAAEQIEKLIQEQKDAAAATAKAEKDKAQLPEAKTAQKDVSKKTDDLRDAPLPPNPEVKTALDKASEAMKQANKNLDNQKPTDAKPNQKDAVKALEQAKDALEKQAAAIEQRREDIAKLEEARKKLDELAREEKTVADDAKKAADASPMKPEAGDKNASDPKKPDTAKLADKQADLQPPTKDVGMQLKDVAPDAAKKVDEAGMKQESAKNDLAKNEPMPGAEKAAEAARKLEEAAKDVDAKLAEKRGQEANDQAALQQNKDPNAAAQQIAKAIEQAKEAAARADDAAKQANPPPMNGQPPMDGPKQPNIAELQKQVADEAGKQNLPDAQKAADQAAKNLQKGDIPNAVQNQQKALEALNQAAKNQPMGDMKDGGMKDGGMKDGDMKDGMGQTPGDLANKQQQLLDATKSLQQSKDATQAAQSAVQQAQANAPNAVQQQLNQANQQLGQANQQLGQGQPDQAGMNQQGAADALQQALNALNAAQQQANQGMQPGMGEPGMGMGEPGMGQQPGQQPGQGQPGQKGQQQAKNGQQPGKEPGQEPGQGEPKNETQSEGDKDGPEKLKNGASSGNGTAGDGGFIHLRKRERDKVQQNAEAQFPAEFRELIKQYNINIKNNKPAMPAATTPPPAAPAPGGR